MTRILLYFFGGLFVFAGFIGVYYFKSYKGTIIPYSGLFMVGSFLIAATGVLLIYLQVRRRATSIHKEYEAWKEKLKQNGEKIKVEFKDCEVKDNFYYEEVQRHGSQAQAFLALTVGGAAANDKPEIQSRHSAVIVYKYENPRTGELQTFMSAVIPKDKVTLSVLIDMQQYTFIYANKSNSEEYFFDLDFLG